ETIDYGPCAFMEAYDPATVFSSIDYAGRYAYGNQPLVAQWNLARFAETLLPLLAATEELALSVAVETLEGFMPRYHGFWSSGMLVKFGLTGSVEAAALIDQALALLKDNAVDYTTFFRALGKAGRGNVGGVLADTIFDDWLAHWRSMDPDVEAMDRVNPVYIPRNHLVEQALTAAMRGDLAPVHTLLEVLAEPYREREGLQEYAAPAPPEFGQYRTFCGT
ncbi:protein adenylyltransferase SelO family protein, partial [Mycolicibacter kumamotonensis]